MSDRRRRTVWGIVARAGVFLLLGAILNVVVAWACALWTQPEEFDRDVPHADFLDRGGSALGISRVQGFGVCELAWEPMTGGYPWDGPWQEIAPFPEWWPRWSATQKFGRAEADGCIYEFAAGWPTLSLSGLTYEPWSSADSNALRGVRAAIALPNPPAGSLPLEEFKTRVLPFGPIWPGFAINTIFYAAILWPLWAAPLAIRRRRRIKHGLCPACAYPIGTSPVCTECGQPLPRGSDVAV